MWLPTAVNRAVADSSASSRLKRNVAQLGASEYCCPTIATSPPNRCSIPSTACVSIHPDPVGTATTTLLRAQPPTRSSSPTTSAASDAVSGAESDRKSAVQGKSVVEGVELGGSRAV